MEEIKNGEFIPKVMQPLFPEENALKLLFTDTDSLAYLIRCDDVTGRLTTQSEHFDFSNLPREDPLFSMENEGVVGKFKDEDAGDAILKFVGLRSKLYAYVKMLREGRTLEEIKKAKGVGRVTVKQDINFEHYERCLYENREFLATWRKFRSVNHSIQQVEQTKKALSCFDDKRYILRDGINTMAYGHYMID